MIRADVVNRRDGHLAAVWLLQVPAVGQRLTFCGKSYSIGSFIVASVEHFVTESTPAAAIHTLRIVVK